MQLKTIGIVVSLTLGILLAPLWAKAQAPAKVWRIGYLTFFPPYPLDEVFRQGLRDLGYVEGQNIAVEYRSAEEKFERVWQLAAELVNLKVDVIVTTTGESTQIVKKATSTIPIVMVASGDAVHQGLVASLARPGGNVTGLTVISPDISGKRLELLKEAVPGVSRIAVLWCPGEIVNDRQWEETQAVARALKVQLQSLELRRRSDVDLEAAFEAASSERAEALVVFDCPRRLSQRRVVELVAYRRLPAMYPFRPYVVDAGGLMSYGPNIRNQFLRAATYVDKILKGARPADLPVEQPPTFELVINLKTAKALGLTIPPMLLFQADEVIK